MTTTQERRVDGIQRVPVEALVEVCGVGAKAAPFEAESADVSGRGIRLRTAYLPEQGTPVVCRFENSGREVIAEGVVAWCQKETRGGEFGVRFTALDARSAETLRELCGIAADGSVPPPTVEAKEPEPTKRVVPGAKVKLHIDGLGSPMRARVDDGKGKHISVGSSLEFLRIGRKLEMESIEDGTRREARIDGLDVMIDPGTGVPRLLVLLKTDGDENTPQPSVVDAARRTSVSKDQKSTSKPADEHRVGPSSAKPDVGESEPTEPDDPTDEQVDAMVGRVRQLAGATRRKLSEVTIQVGARLAPGVSRAFDRVRGLSRRSAEPPRRRTTAAPAASTTPSERKLRPQNRASQPDTEPSKPTSPLKSPRMRRAAGSVVAAGLIGTVLLVALRSPEPSKSGANADVDASKSDSLALAAPGNAPASGNASAPNGANGLPGSNPAATPGVTGQQQNANGATNGGLIAPVPLFGPTTMATLESAAVGDPTGESPAIVAAREQALAKATQAALASGVDASKLSEEPNAETAAASEEPATKPEDVPPFGHGRMKDPILYRLKLDEPGSALKGTSSSKGFTVTIPGRKLLESPKGFVKRDDRFAKISAANSADGVKITWQFKDEAPPFRVRLRKSSVEFLISEAAKAPAKTN